ncbi:hypothetical protein HOY80DRAFT_596707 [Tuber brumale]|nr:hypothetical protein HOY80DRAFT_596707 [Tuber brumale]
MAVPFTKFYNFTFASYECSWADGDICAGPNLKIDGCPTFNLYKDGVFIEQWGGRDHDMFIEGFALFVEGFLSEKFPGTREPVDLSAPWSADARKAAGEYTKNQAPNTSVLHEEARERSIMELWKIWGFPEARKEVAHKVGNTTEGVVEGGEKGGAGREADLLKYPTDDTGDGNEDIEIRLNEEPDEKIVEKSSVISRLHRLIKGIFHIHPGWYSQRVTHWTDWIP